jgi:hypothetical protein
MNKYRRRQIGLMVSVFIAIFVFSIFSNNSLVQQQGLLGAVNKQDPIVLPQYEGSELALNVVEELAVKGRSSKTGYSRAQFGNGWASERGCDTRNVILNRDLINASVDEQCHVIKGTLNDPYTGKVIQFTRGAGSSADVQIDHVVALSDAWQKGAQYWTYNERVEFSNDPLNLLAVGGSENQIKGASDAASWLPPYKPFRCQYVARQISVKIHYDLWVTQAEKDSIKRVLSSCPDQLVIRKN